METKPRIKFYGARGSIPVCGSSVLTFGGNTTCLQLEIPNANRVIVIDAGTGIRDLGKDLMKRDLRGTVIDIFFTHFHWDHIQGFPFFAPAYVPDQSINITTLGKDRDIKNLKDIFGTQMQQVYFPVQLDNMGAAFGFHNFDEANRQLKDMDGRDMTVRAIRHDHPGGAYSYRFEINGKSLVFSTDIEHGSGIDRRIVDFSRDADVLIHDGQYTSKELEHRHGWGHSSYDQAMRMAELANARRLIITHHDPDHDDTFLSEMERNCRRRFPETVLAREKMEIDW